MAAEPVSLRFEDNTDPLEGGIAWINTGGPIKLKDLKGKIVLLDFWTFCCINCHHILPDLAKLEEKYKNELVVIGVHTPKFTAEHNNANVRQKVREYGIKHPVVNDAEQNIWNTFGVNSWPTLVLIDTQGRPLGKVSGEGHYDVLDKAIGRAIEQAKAAKTLDETPVKFFPENEKPDNTPLLYPGKIVADASAQRLFVADTGHNRLVMAHLDGDSPITIGNGKHGLVDGSFDKAEFNHPQGMTLIGDILYVADTENHAIRAVNLKKKLVSTVIGNGKQGRGASGRDVALNSPWDLTHVATIPRMLFIAMAGPHQIWTLDLETKRAEPFAGNGRENIVDGPLSEASFAQPSGITTDGNHLFVADSEVSALRQISLGGEMNLVKTIVGSGLFDYGDDDGIGSKVRLQHCLGVTFGGGKLYVADTYNNKIKVSDPRTREVKTLAGDGRPGLKDAPAEFYQPGGVSLAGKVLYVADTNNHAIRRIDLTTKAVSILNFPDLTPPKPLVRKPSFRNAKLETLAKTTLRPGNELTINLTFPVPVGFKLNTEGSIPYDVEAPESPELIAPSSSRPPDESKRRARRSSSRSHYRSRASPEIPSHSRSRCRFRSVAKARTSARSAPSAGPSP